MDFIAREVLALRIVWHVAETFLSEYDALQSKPTRQCWKACTEAFLKAIRNHTKGIFGDYSMKITLDGVLLSQPRLELAVSWWPMHCPAYKIALPALYANCTTSRQDLFWAASIDQHNVAHPLTPPAQGSNKAEQRKGTLQNLL